MEMRVNFLMEHGWEPVVLKADKESGVYLYNVASGKIKVHQVADPLAIFSKAHVKDGFSKNCSRENFSMTKRILSRLFFPDLYARWIIPLTMHARKIIENEKVDIIYSMNYPASLHLSALMLKKMMGLPWVAEFRDPLAAHPFFQKGSFLYPHTLYKLLEKMIVRNADKVVYYDGIPIEKYYFHKTYPLFQRKIRVLPFVGFNQEKFNSIVPTSFNRFTITYGGRIYREAISVLKNFLLGFSIIIKKYNLSSQNIGLYLLSDKSKELESIIKRLYLDSFVEICGRKYYDRYLEFLKGSNLLLHFLPIIKGYEYSVSLKTWDYIGVRKPILALVPSEWKLAKFIESKRIGIVVDPNEPKRIADTLEKIYFSKDRGLSIFSPSESFLQSLDARKVEKQFCNILNELIIN